MDNIPVAETPGECLRRGNAMDAMADGFPALYMFQEALQERNDIPSDDTLIGLLTFRWTDGPHDIVCHNCLKRENHDSPGTLTQYCSECIADPDDPEGGKLVP